MTPEQFDLTAKELFGHVLGPFGFVSNRSKYCTFYRKASEDIYHVVLPDLGTHGEWFDVKVYPASPLLEVLFDERFPDELGIPTDRFSYLHPVSGVGPDQEMYQCKTEAVFRQVFDEKIKPALVNKAIPYLEKVMSIDAMVPLIRNKTYLALALSKVGKVDQAMPLLVAEKQRLSKLGSGDRKVAALIKHIDSLLGSF